MKKDVKLITKTLAFVMAMLILAVSLPVSIFADLISEDLNNVQRDNTVTNTGTESNSTATDVFVLEEDESLRGRNIKHFKLSDGTSKAVVYSQPVHYKDTDGNWVDIDNALNLNDSQYSTSNKSEIKFANKSGSNGLISIKDGDYKIDFTPLNTNKVSVEIENPQKNNSRKFDDVKVLRNLISKATYSNIYDGIDIEYILTGNNVKENIIVKSKQNDYTYSFELKLNKLTAKLSNNNIILSDSTTGEEVYVIPTPYMYDANDVLSTDVEYSLTQNSKWKYTFTVTANSDWINASDRVFPVTIDPSIVIYTDYDTFIMSDNADNSTMNYMVIGNFFDNDIPVFMKFNDIPNLPSGSVLLQAKVAMYISYIENPNNLDMYIGVYKATQEWINNIDFTYQNASNYYESVPEHSLEITGLGTYEWDITSLYNQWINYTPNYGICVKAVNLPQNENARVHISTLEQAPGLVPPQIEISYTFPKGIEDYYGYVHTSLGTIGESYVNLYNGSLTYTNNLATIETPSLSYEINMVYNSIDKCWTTSFDEKIELVEDSISENVIRYLWHDPDGTLHYFSPYLQKNSWGDYVQYEFDPTGNIWQNPNPTEFYPEDDIDYVLTKTAKGEFILKNYDGTQKLFDVTGRLSRICDAQGNVRYFHYSNGNLMYIDCKTINGGVRTQIEFKYDEENKLTNVYNFQNNTRVNIFRTNNRIAMIEYRYTDEREMILPFNLLSFSYDTESRLNEIYELSNGFKIEYDYNDNDDQAISVTETRQSVVDKQIDLIYNEDVTIHNTNSDFSNEVYEKVEKYTFDNKGRNKSVHTTYYEEGEMIETFEEIVHEDNMLPSNAYYTTIYSENINDNSLPYEYTSSENGEIVRYSILSSMTEFLNIPNTEANVNSTANSNEQLTTNSSFNEGGESINPLGIIGEPDFQQVTDTTQDPYHSICYIIRTYNVMNKNTDKEETRTFGGTGFLIGSDLMMTAGHVLYVDATKTYLDDNGIEKDEYEDGIDNPRFPDSILVIPGSYVDENGNLEDPFGTYAVEMCYVQKEWIETKSSNYDWAVCTLNRG